MKCQCTQDFIFEDGSISFKKGNTYDFSKSERTNNGKKVFLCPKNEQGKEHFIDEWYLRRYFQKVGK